MATEPLYGDPVNAYVWQKYAVLLGALTATVPTDNAAFTLNDPAAGTPVTNQWDALGVLDADNPFDGGAESMTATDHSGAGIGVYATSYRDQKEMVSFTAKETRKTVLGFLYDATGLTLTSGNLSGTLKMRDPSKRYLVAFQRVTQDGTKMERRISKVGCQIESITRNNGNDEQTYTFNLVVPPTTNRDLYTYYLGAA